MKPRKLCSPITVAIVLLLAVPIAVFAGGSGEEGITEDQVIDLIRSNTDEGVSESDVMELIQASQGDAIGKCGDCHGGDTKYPVAGAQLSYSQSGHYLGWDKHAQNSWYANGNGCQKCHTNEGFREYLETGAVEGYVAYPSQPGCFSCHDPHVTGDFSLTTTEPVMISAGVEYDEGTGNLCANCHQGRRNVEDSIAAGTISAYFGPHHGPEADMILGVNGFEMPGKSYSSSAHTFVIQNSCVDCHLALPEGRYSASPEVGGHSFYVKGEVHGATKVNASACATCHEDVNEDATGEFFNIMAKADYDGDGDVESAQAEVEGLLHLIVNSSGTGVLQTSNPPAYRRDGSWNSTRGLEFPVETVGAVWNYKFVEEDRSIGVHNTTYAVQLLMDTINFFDSSFNMSARPN